MLVSSVEAQYAGEQRAGSADEGIVGAQTEPEGNPADDGAQSMRDRHDCVYI